MNLKNLLFASVIVLSANAAIAQEDSEIASHLVNISIPQVALLDLESTTGTTISLAGTAPTEAGLPMDFSGATNSSIYMNYSSIVSGTSLRNVTVAIETGTLPAGLELTVVASDYAGVGKGTMGSSKGTITLNGDGQNILEGIGSAYTGDKGTNGHLLTYKLASTSAYGDLDFSKTAQLKIIYTLTDI